MSKYIDADLLFETVCKRVNNPAIRGWLGAIINDIPSVNAADIMHEIEHLKEENETYKQKAEQMAKVILELKAENEYLEERRYDQYWQS